jgi:glutathione synthase/RimK-type ligase-like ATP-grasp enzyme
VLLELYQTTFANGLGGGNNGSAMLTNRRIFVDALRKYCAEREIAIDVRSDGWLIVMQRDDTRACAFGYDIGLNSAVAHRIANDKAATAEVLEMSGIACVPHTLFLSPEMNQYVAQPGSWEAMLRLLDANPHGIVVKPNEGTTGESVFLVKTKAALELAVSRIFASHLSLAISPYVDIEDEVRVVLLDGDPIVVYGKNRPSIVGDGQRSLLELALAATAAAQRSTVLPGMIADLDKTELDFILPSGQRRVLNWRHNLDAGAHPTLLNDGKVRDACVGIAIRAAKAIDIRFASIDIVQVGGVWRVLEINSGVMMEALSQRHPDLVYAAYHSALDRLFQ